MCRTTMQRHSNRSKCIGTYLIGKSLSYDTSQELPGLRDFTLQPRIQKHFIRKNHAACLLRPKHSLFRVTWLGKNKAVSIAARAVKHTIEFRIPTIGHQHTATQQ